jgi:hypothetical protein
MKLENNHSHSPRATFEMPHNFFLTQKNMRFLPQVHMLPLYLP